MTTTAIDLTDEEIELILARRKQKQIESEIKSKTLDLIKLALDFEGYMQKHQPDYSHSFEFFVNGFGYEECDARDAFISVMEIINASRKTITK